MNGLRDKWMKALLRTWEPLTRMPITEAECAALALEHGIEAWAEGSRDELIERAVNGNRQAFLTLALKVWTADAVAGVPSLYLPIELAKCQEANR